MRRTDNEDEVVGCAEFIVSLDRVGCCCHGHGWIEGRWMYSASMEIF